MSNAIPNTIYIVLFLFTMLSLTAVLSIGDILVEKLTNQMEKLNLNIPDYSLDFYLQAKNLILKGTRFFSYLTFTLLILTSFISPQNLTSYVMSTIVLIITTIAILFVVGNVWNIMIMMLGNQLDITPYQSDVLFVADYFTEIVVANLIAGLLSFVWSKNRTRGLIQNEMYQ